MARAVKPSLAASATSSAGVAAPSRKLYEEWQCNSAHGRLPGAGGMVSARRSAAGRRLGPVCLLAPVGWLGPARWPAPVGWLASASWPAERQDIRRSSSRQGTGGLSQPLADPHQ